MPYRSLQTSDGTNQTVSTDTNKNVIYLLGAATAFNTERFDVGDGAVITIIPTSIAGTAGSIKLQRSADGINFTDVYQDGSLVSYVVDNVLSTSTIVYDLKGGWCHLVYAVGSVTAGTLLINVATRS